MVIGHLFPRDAATMAGLAREAGASRIWAGIQYSSDVTAADALGRSVAERAVGDGSGAALR